MNPQSKVGVAMASDLDPYRQWLGIRPDEDRNHYRLLGLRLFEDQPAVIATAVERQQTQIETFRTGEHASVAQRLLDELSAAAACLLEPSQRAAYDAQLRHDLQVSASRQRRRLRQLATVVIPVTIGLVLIAGLVIFNPWRTAPPPAVHPRPKPPPAVTIQTPAEHNARPALPTSQTRRPVPSPERQAEILKRLDTVYDFAQAKSPQQQRALAKLLFQQAERVRDNAAERYVALKKVGELAGAGGDEMLRRQAAERLRAEFELNPKAT